MARGVSVDSHENSYTAATAAVIQIYVETTTVEYNKNKHVLFTTSKHGKYIRCTNYTTPYR